MSNQTKLQSLIFSFFAFVLVCSSSNIAYAQNERIGNDGGMQLMAKSIPGIDVQVKKKPGTSNSNARTGDLVATGKTDNDGRFNLGVLSAGEYFITVKIPDEVADSIESIIESANANAKTYSESKSNTAAAEIAISGALSVTLITSVDLSRRQFSSQAAPVFGKIYEIKIQATGRQVVTGQVSIVIDQPGVK